MLTARASCTSLLQLPSNPYIYQILPVGSGHPRLALSSSDDAIHVLDANTLQPVPNGVFRQAHQGITAMASSAATPDVIISAGRDASIFLRDLRDGDSLTNLLNKENQAAYLSLAYSGNLVAAGTEMMNYQATVSIWDVRNPAAILRRFVESHNDDVTELVFHPSQTRHLLSGSTDALLNIFDIDQAEEEDALLSITNHGSSIHHARFLTPQHFYGLSHDERLSIYRIDTAGGSEIEVSEVKHFGDVRSTLGCEYVVDIFDHPNGPMLVAGTHSESSITLSPLTHTDETWDLDEDARTLLPGAHGEEIVRSVYCDPSGTIFSAGEDGCIRAWQLGNNRAASAPESTSAKKTKDNRFKPY